MTDPDKNPFGDIDPSHFENPTLETLQAFEEVKLGLFLLSRRTEKQFVVDFIPGEERGYDAQVSCERQISYEDGFSSEPTGVIANLSINAMEGGTRLEFSSESWLQAEPNRDERAANLFKQLSAATDEQTVSWIMEACSKAANGSRGVDVSGITELIETSPFTVHTETTYGFGSFMNNDTYVSAHSQEFSEGWNEKKRQEKERGRDSNNAMRAAHGQPELESEFNAPYGAKIGITLNTVDTSYVYNREHNGMETLLIKRNCVSGSRDSHVISVQERMDMEITGRDKLTEGSLAEFTQVLRESIDSGKRKSSFDS